MRGINKAILIGNLGSAPTVRTLRDGGQVTNISMATSETWHDKQSGERREKTEWHRVVFFGKLAEIAGQYLTKGSKIYIEGKLQTTKWQDSNGTDRYTTEIVVDQRGVLQMLDSKPNGQQQPSPSQAYQQPAQQQPSPSQAYQQPAQQQPTMNAQAAFNDDIPF